MSRKRASERTEDYVYINPLTQREVKHGSATYNKLVDAGVQIIKTKRDSKKPANTGNYNNWVARIMEDNDYKIVETVKDGDCMFDSIAKALKLKVSDLRELVSTHVTHFHFQFWKLAHNSDPDNDEYKFMKGIHNLDELKKLIATPAAKVKKGNVAFWGEHLSLNSIAKDLGVHFFLFDQAIKKVSCGDNDVNVNSTKFVLLAYSFSHYKLVTYKGKMVLNANDIPDELFKKYFKEDCGSIKKLFSGQS